MPRSVAIRLGTEGKAQVKADFVEIGDTGDAQAKRWSRSFDSATKDVEAALQRQSNAAAKLSMITPQSATQMRINDTNSTGYGQHEGSARQSAMAFRELIAAQEQMENRANALRAAIDPAFAAQQRFDREIAEARTLISTGAITLDEYSKRHVQLQQQMNVSAKGLHNQAEASGAAKAGYQQLNFQLSDIATQFSSGTPPMQIFAQQSGQLFQALGLIASGGAAAGKGVEAAASASEDSAPDIAGFGEQVTGVAEKAEGMTGKLGAVAGFMTGPWGAALLVGISLLTPFIAKLFESNNALDDAVDKLKKDAEATEVNRQAQLAFAKSAEGVAAAIRENTAAVQTSLATQRTAAEQNNINARANLAEELSIRAKTRARLEDARAMLQAEIRASRMGGERGDVATMGIASKQAEVDAIDQALTAQSAAVAKAEAALGQSRIALAAEQGKEAARLATDPIARINRLYGDQIEKLKASKAAAVARGEAVGAASKAEFDAIERNRQAAIKAEQDRQKAANSTKRDQETLTANSVASMLRGALPGVHVTSTTGGKHVANSYHYRNQAVDFVPSGGMQSMTKADVRKIFESRGIDIVELLGPGDKGHSDHFHVAWTKGKMALDEFKDAAKRAKEAAHDAEEANDKLNADLREVVGAFDPARAAADAYAESLAKIDTLVGEGKLTVDQGNGLRMAAYHAEAKRMADESYETFKKLFGTDDPMADAVEGARRNIGNRVDQMAEQDEAKVKVVTTALDELRGYGSDFVSTVLSEDTWSSWGNAGKTILSSLKNEFITLALLNPLKNLINGDKALPTLSSAIGNIGKLFKPGTNAAGTEYWPGGMSLVGENGPEIVSMPRGSRVTTAQETRQLFANDNPSPSVTHNHFSGNLMTPEFWERINAGDAGAAMQGAAGGAAMSQAEGTRSAARRLGRFR
ncbi:hypothetical protein [Sphingomonas melonis]|uniref:Bacteriophage tail tape measure N-terminal domain-containing protein n=1 Tax=Sphingomonas melonis TaxID=152682 RepID=A0A7Y9FKB4_9SPHN|nr:hypothetical protein [Sphingomonas melonis]NYD88915.1 hypothetical protein [Sphingomonas melonis]